MSLIAGSYERYIWGYKLNKTQTKLTQLFSYPSHLSPIKSLAVSHSLAVSGSSDDTIKLYDLSSSHELATLPHYHSTVTSLSFYTPPSLSFPRNLISSSSDGFISIFDTDPFVSLKSLMVHRKGVNSVAVHPSGKLGLTVGRDECLGMVNLVRGRRSFCCRLGKEAERVGFFEGGEKFFMVLGQSVEVHEAEDAKLLLEFVGQKRVLCAEPGLNGILFTGGEDRNVTAWDTTSGKVAHCIEGAHSARVKGVVVLSRSEGASAAEDPYIVASASSDGVIRVWDVRMGNRDKPNPLAEANTKSRLTCLAGSSRKPFKHIQVSKTSQNEEQDAAVGR